jgi:hypothetical protein
VQADGAAQGKIPVNERPDTFAAGLEIAAHAVVHDLPGERLVCIGGNRDQAGFECHVRTLLGHRSGWLFWSAGDVDGSGRWQGLEAFEARCQRPTGAPRVGAPVRV